MNLKSLYIFLTALFIATAIGACKKESVPAASYQDGVWFYQSNSNTSQNANVAALVKSVFKRDYSFYFLEGGDHDTLWLPEVRVMGTASDKDRPIKLVALDSSTAVAGKHYRLLNAVMPAHALKTRIGLLLLRSTDLDDKTVKLHVQLQPSDAFPASVANDTLSRDLTFFSGNTYHVSITNIPQQPPYWSTVSIYFQSWSRVKYNLIYATIGVKIGLTANNTEEINNLYPWFLRVKKALEDYNKANPNNPLKDEKGNTIYL